ncbi:SIT4-associating protein Sap185p [Monosporozyma unispora]|nr:hypothetical protein C6P44_005012 [Kazachstania unispora]
MSGSFWKFGQDYSMESNVTKLLNNAFIKRNDIMETKSIDQDTTTNKENVGENNDNDQESISLLTNEEDFENYNPNLDILTDLVDDEELYTELMCSNFKLLMYLKYPIVLEKLIDYITNEKFLLDSYENEIQQMNQQDPDLDDKKLNLNQEVIILSKEEQDEKLNELEKLQDSASSDSGSEISQETSVTIPPETEEQIEFRRARMAAEILSADVWQISSTIMDNEFLLNKIWSILENHGSHLSITVSTYFMKINERLLDINMTQMIDYLLTKEYLVDKFLKHINNPSLMDFMLKVISTDKSDSPTGIINLLYKQDFIPKVIDLLDSSNFDSCVQSSAADFIKAFVTLSANSNNEISIGIGPNELTRQLVSTKMVERLINIMLEGGTSLSNGVGIIIEIIRKNNSDYDFIQVMYTTLETHPPNDRDPIHLTYLIKLFAKHMPEFVKLLDNVEKKTLPTPIGDIEPLGFERFKICELIAELLHCSNMTLLNEPQGETITRERDLIRHKTLHSESLTQLELDQLNKALEQLHLKQQQPTSDNKDKEEESKDQEQEQDNSSDIEDMKDEYENALEIYPNDEISISSEIESIIREKHIPGDDLKISLQNTGILGFIVDMFFKFEWNNFLHNVVFDIIQQTFNGPLKCGYNKFLIKDLLSTTRLTDNIIDGDTKCIEHEEKEGVRLGYMGHLTLIAEEVAKFVEYIDEMKITFDTGGILDVLNEDKWQEFMNTTLAETREKYNAVLGDFILEDDEENEGEQINEDTEQDSQDEFTNENDDENSYEKYETVNPNEDDYDYYDENINFNDKDYLENDDDAEEIDSEKNHQPVEEMEGEEHPDDYYEYEDASGHKTILNLNDNNENSIRASPLNEILTKPVSYHRENSENSQDSEDSESDSSSDSNSNRNSDSDDEEEFSPTDNSTEEDRDNDEDEVGVTLCRAPSIEK